MPATYPYKARSIQRYKPPPNSSDNLAFAKGELLTVVWGDDLDADEDDADWLKGTNEKGDTGLFPAGFVVKVEQEQEEEEAAEKKVDEAPAPVVVETAQPASIDDTEDQKAPAQSDPVPISDVPASPPPPVDVPSTPPSSVPSPPALVEAVVPPISSSTATIEPPTPNPAPTASSSGAPAPPPKKPMTAMQARIAALNAASANSAPPGPPPPRPKPTVFRTKAMPSPSPAITSTSDSSTSTSSSPAPAPPALVSASSSESTNTEGTGGMSASDAKESISRGGSLKDRIAALQGGGAFGGGPAFEPPAAPGRPPKPWKRPPAPAPPPVEGDDVDGESKSVSTSEQQVQGEEAASDTSSPPTRIALPSLTSPLTSPPPLDIQSTPLSSTEPVIESQRDAAPLSSTKDREVAAEVGGESDSIENESAAVVQNTDGVTAEEEEQNEESAKRAAIAKRMASLGGQRVGMAMPALPKRAAGPRARKAAAPAAPSPTALEAEPPKPTESSEEKKEVSEGEGAKEVESVGEKVATDAPVSDGRDVSDEVKNDEEEKASQFGSEELKEDAKKEESPFLEKDKKDSEEHVSGLPIVAAIGGGVGLAGMAGDVKVGDEEKEELKKESVIVKDSEEDEFDTPALPGEAEEAEGAEGAEEDEFDTPAVPSEDSAAQEHNIEPSQSEEASSIEVPRQERESAPSPPPVPAGRPPIPPSFSSPSSPPIPPVRSIPAPPPPTRAPVDDSPEVDEEEEEDKIVNDVDDGIPPPTPVARPAIPAIPASFKLPDREPAKESIVIPREPVPEPEEEEQEQEQEQDQEPELEQDEEETGVGEHRRLEDTDEPSAPSQGFVSPPAQETPSEATTSTSSDPKPSPVTVQPGDGDDNEEEQEEDPEVARRRALAARMAKLGGMNPMRMGPMFPPIGGLRKPAKQKSESEESPAEQKPTSSVSEQEDAPPPPRRLPGIPTGGMLLPGIVPRFPKPQSSEDDTPTSPPAPVSQDESAPPPLPAGRPGSLPPRRSIPIPEPETQVEESSVASHPQGFVSEPGSLADEGPEQEREDVEQEQAEDDEGQQVGEEDEELPPPPPPRVARPNMPPPLPPTTAPPTSPPPVRRAPSVPQPGSPSSPSRQGSLPSRQSTLDGGILGVSIPRGSIDLERVSVSDEPANTLSPQPTRGSMIAGESISSSTIGSAPSQEVLKQLSQTLGAQIFAAAHSKSSDKSRTTTDQFISFCFSRATDPAPPSNYSYGIPIQTVGKGPFTELDEPRAGDIAVFWDAKFKQTIGTSKVGSTDVPHVTVVQAWDSSKRKIRVLEVGKDRQVVENAWRVEDLKSGTLVVYRVAGNDMA
ncbi:hypothetical protein T439DRAFT_350457 [Meredithblackwellia eburnea MCA 4105]